MLSPAAAKALDERHVDLGPRVVAVRLRAKEAGAHPPGVLFISGYASTFLFFSYVFVCHGVGGFGVDASAKRVFRIVAVDISSAMAAAKAKEEGNAAFRRKDFTEAVQCFTRSLTLNSQDPQVCACQHQCRLYPSCSDQISAPWPIICVLRYRSHRPG